MSLTKTVATNSQRVVKLAVVGAGGVGKSTLIKYLTTGMFLETRMTVGVDIQTWSVEIAEDENVKIAMFDFGGQKQFRFLQKSLILGAETVLLVFDCTSYHSLLQLGEWFELISKLQASRCLLVGTKIDLGISILEKEIQAFAKKIGIDYILVSSKTGENFEILSEKLRDMIKKIQ